MAFLGDYLGHLLSEVTVARMKADLEAVRIAELYSTHPLLKHMPIPHFRLPAIEIDVPVLVQSADVQSTETVDPPSPPTLVKTFKAILNSQLKAEKVRLKGEVREALNKSLEEKAEQFINPVVGLEPDLTNFAEELSKSVLPILKKNGGRIEEVLQKKFTDNLNHSTRVEFLNLRRPSPRLEILATSQDIKEFGTNENMTNIRLKITEEAFEWTTIESDDSTERRLIIE